MHLKCKKNDIIENSMHDINHDMTCHDFDKMKEVIYDDIKILNILQSNLCQNEKKKHVNS